MDALRISTLQMLALTRELGSYEALGYCAADSVSPYMLTAVLGFSFGSRRPTTKDPDSSRCLSRGRMTIGETAE